MDAYTEKTRWFREARLGMFIHWGLYAIPGRGEWVQSLEQITPEVYGGYFDEFEAEDYDPVSWARLARRAGMKYAVLTAKHHEGFCLFDSTHTDFTSMHAPCKRDLVREYVEAFRAEGIRVGLYYSLLDWHHPDYPHSTDSLHPCRGDARYPDESRDFERYLDYMHAQIRELCTNYGKIDLFWFDFSYDHLSGPNWRADELIAMIGELQPGAIIDNRLEFGGESFGSLTEAAPNTYCGDYVSPEKWIPPRDITRPDGASVCWEAGLTLNNIWGYSSNDCDFKPASMLIKKLEEAVSMNGNLLLNIGPDPRGNIPEPCVRALLELGEWMHLNGRSIYGCTAANLPVPACGRFTYCQERNELYLHVFEDAAGPVQAPIAPDKVVAARYLATGAEVSKSQSWAARRFPEYLFLSLGPNKMDTYLLPDPRDTVIKLRLREPLDG